MMAATNTSAMYSWKNMMIISLIVAPITFLIAISFCLWVMIEDEIEYIPNKEMRIQRKLKIENNLNIAISDLFNSWILLSTVCGSVLYSLYSH
jgi:flagellar basal body-associated protein FliL